MVDHRAAWLREGPPCGSCAAVVRRARGVSPLSTRLIASCWLRRVGSLGESPSHLSQASALRGHRPQHSGTRIVCKGRHRCP
eukprot:9497692-Pyramimonas_sp.AAC.1